MAWSRDAIAATARPHNPARRAEFDGDALDATKWSVEEWPARTFNDELQRYTTGTVTVKDGVLEDAFRRRVLEAELLP